MDHKASSSSHPHGPHGPKQVAGVGLDCSDDPRTSTAWGDYQSFFRHFPLHTLNRISELTGVLCALQPTGKPADPYLAAYPSMSRSLARMLQCLLHTIGSMGSPSSSPSPRGFSSIHQLLLIDVLVRRKERHPMNNTTMSGSSRRLRIVILPGVFCSGGLYSCHHCRSFNYRYIVQLFRFLRWMQTQCNIFLTRAVMHAMQRDLSGDASLLCPCQDVFRPP